MLTLQFIPYTEIENLSSHSRIDKIIRLIKDEKIVLIQGKLKKTEETELIRKTMEVIGNNPDNAFKGIELAVIMPSNHKEDFLKKIKNHFINMLLGDRQGLTVVGPASIVKEIKQDPEKLQLFIEDFGISQGKVVSTTTSKNPEQKPVSRKSKKNKKGRR
jgi:hypothetical protein